jgi:leucyl aminopeptidase
MPILARANGRAIPIWFVTAQTWPSIERKLPASARAFARQSDFAPRAGRHCVAPGLDGSIAAVVFGIEAEDARFVDPMLPGKLVSLLPKGVYRFANAPHDGARGLTLATLAWMLASYRFGRYKKGGSDFPQLAAPEGVDARRVESVAASVSLVRDLVNTPANDMGPAALEAAAVALCRSFRLKPRVIRGAQLLRQNFPLIHAVGRAAAQEPRLVDFSWGPQRAPKVTLVGKGVCFDTGGLDIKPSSAMLLMKKDMAGAATALGLARMIMEARLPVRLRVLLPIVENAIAGDAFRPGDIYRSRKGLTVEIGNTDAEGRLILADALALADEEAPEMLFNFATLTGAARVALGPDLPPFYTMDDRFAADLAQSAQAVHDPLWRLPLWEPYDSWIDGKISDLNNVSPGPFAGSITAALFLRRFVSRAKCWAHFDIYAWNPSTKPARPEGGEAQAARALFDLIAKKYPAKR